jgi:hypothetical protein
MIRKMTPADFARWDRFAALPEMDRARLGPESRWLATGRMMHWVAEDKDRFVGRLSAFVNPRMQDQPLPTGLLGCVDFSSESFGRDATTLRALVDSACGWLSEQGMRTARGPMNFSTWNSYRAITYSTEYPAFLGENVLDARYGAFFAEVMKPVATYRTALVSDVEKGQAVARTAKIDRAEQEHGITLRHIPREQVGSELAMLYQVASRIFPCDWSFAPIAADEFRELLFPVSQAVPDFHLLVAQAPGGEPIGLCYGYASPGITPKTAVLKTFGVVPEWQSKMISYLLAYRFHMDLIAKGYQHFLHAMMKEDNRSRHMSDYYATKVRGYTLYERAI